MFPGRKLLINAYLAIFDLAVTAASYLVTLVFGVARGELVGAPLRISPDQILALVWLLSIQLVLLTYFGMYRSRRIGSLLSDLWVVVRVSLAGLVILEALTRAAPWLEPGPSFIVVFACTNFACLSVARFAIRLFLHGIRRRGHNLKVLLLVTSGALRERLVSKIGRHSHYGYKLLPPLLYSPRRENERERVWQEFQTQLDLARIDDVILALPAEANGLTARLVNECERRGINVRLVPDLFPIVQCDTQTYDLDGIPLVNVRLYPAELLGYVVIKRLLDALVSFVVLAVLSPVYFLIALLIKLTSAGPVLFTQERMGMNGRRFHMLKFRTMYAASRLDADTHWTSRDDPNVTPLGRWLRWSSLDELPQFWNVLRGDMSIVGPRPERPFFIERFQREIPDYMARHYVKSGITGWAQVHGFRGDTSIQERLVHDLYYIRNWALGLDFKILFLTFTRGFFHRNAY